MQQKNDGRMRFDQAQDEQALRVAKFEFAMRFDAGRSKPLPYKGGKKNAGKMPALPLFQDQVHGAVGCGLAGYAEAHFH